MSHLQSSGAYAAYIRVKRHPFTKITLRPVVDRVQCEGHGVKEFGPPLLFERYSTNIQARAEELPRTGSLRKWYFKTYPQEYRPYQPPLERQDTGAIDTRIVRSQTLPVIPDDDPETGAYTPIEIKALPSEEGVQH